MRTAIVTAALAVGLTVLVGCEPETPKATGQATVLPPVNSHADTLKQTRPAKPGVLQPPKRGGTT